VKLWLPLSYEETMPEFMRDVTDIGHQGTGNLEAQIVQEHELDQLLPYLRQSLTFVSGE
jgi:predicted transport protein